MKRLGYTHFGTTENRLLLVLSAFSGGGSGNFIFLHILDVAAAPALDSLTSPQRRTVGWAARQAPANSHHFP